MIIVISILLLEFIFWHPQEEYNLDRDHNILMLMSHARYVLTSVNAKVTLQFMPRRFQSMIAYVYVHDTISFIGHELPTQVSYFFKQVMSAVIQLLF